MSIDNRHWHGLSDPSGSTAGTVTPFSGPGGLRAGRSRLAQVEAYWTALYRDGQPPARAEIDPRGIETALEYAFIAERITRGEVKMRVGGAHLSDLMGMEVRGMPLSSLFMPEARRDLARIVEEVFDRPALGRLVMRSQGAMGQAELQAEMVLLPLRGDDGAISRLLGCLVSEGVPGRTPRRFDILRAGTQPTRSAATGGVAMAPRQPQTTTASAHGLAEAPRSFAGAPTKARKTAPYLRLVKTD